MNAILRGKFENFETSIDEGQKFINSVYTIEAIIIYYSTVLYCHTKYFGYSDKDIVEIIMSNFDNRNPLTSSWNLLLIRTLDLLQKNKLLVIPNLPNDFKLFIDATTNMYNSSQKRCDLKSFLECFLKIKNKVCSHGGGINQRHDLAFIKTFQNVNYYKLPYLLNDYFEHIIESQLVNIISIKPDEENLFVDYQIMSDDIYVNKTTYINNDEELYVNHAYCYFKKDNKFVSTHPFFIFRDSTLRYYNGLTNKGIPEYQDFNSQSIIEVKSNKDAFKRIISDDIDNIKYSALPIKIQFENGVYHNLPKPPYEQFIGRTDLIRKIKQALHHNRLFIISISGIGGVGKTAIAIKVAYEILQTKQKDFSFIIWVSAKKTYLTETGIKTEPQSFQTLNQLLDLILNMTGFTDGLNFTYQKKKQYVVEILSLDKFLIIVDNFETIDNSQSFINFFEEIGNSTFSKIVITSRKQLGTSEKIIDIREMEKQEYEEYVDYLSSRYGIPFPLSKRMRDKLYSFTGGLPLAIEIILSKSKKIDDLNKTIYKIEEENITKDGILDFSYSESFALLSQNEKMVLYAITLSDYSKMSNIIYITQINEFDVEEAINKLKMFSFINENFEGEEIKYTVLPLTKVFVEKIIKADIKNEVSARYEEYIRIIQQIGIDTSEYDIPLTSDSIGIKYAKAAYIQARDHKFKESEENFKKAIKANENDAEVWYLWARALFDSSNIISRNYFDKAILLAKAGQKEKMLTDYGKALLSQKNYYEATRIFREVVSINTQNKSAYHYLGKAYYEIAFELRQKGNNKAEVIKYQEKSISAFEQSFYDDIQSEFETRHNAINCYYLARLMKHTGKLDASKKYIFKGLRYQPGNYRLTNLLERWFPD